VGRSLVTLWVYYSTFSNERHTVTIRERSSRNRQVSRLIARMIGN
jgi:hypothetical protein